MVRTPLAALTAVLSGLVLALAGTLVLTHSSAHAATLQPVTGFGSNPGNLDMYSYRPDGLPPGAPLVVALHGCTQDAATFHSHSGWRQYADQWGFAIVYPQQRATNQGASCFRWYEAAHTRRDAGEALSIRQMVSYAVTHYGSDPHRVFITGLSAGGAMAAAMLATYPDVFAAGSVVAGLPYRCAPPETTVMCQFVGVQRTPQQWGDLVRNAYPGYQGPRPKVAIWHGTSDFTVTSINATELMKQWTNVLGISQTPSETRSLPADTTLDIYGADQVRRYLISGMGHGQPVDPGSATDQCGTAGAYFLDRLCAAYHDAVWFGLADDGGPPPTATPTPSPTATPTPSPTATPPPVCVTYHNYAHTLAGRAYQVGGYTYAVGSDDPLGLWSVGVVTTLRQVGPDHWVNGC